MQVNDSKPTLETDYRGFTITYFKTVETNKVKWDVESKSLSAFFPDEAFAISEAKHTIDCILGK